MRGFDSEQSVRAMTRPASCWGNKSLLFNAEYLINVAGPVRLVLFYDAGQVRDVGEHFAWKEDSRRSVPATAHRRSAAYDPSRSVRCRTHSMIPRLETVVTGQANAFKTSTGAEIRFFMPVLNALSG